jgi:hypothetical protein
LPPGIWIQPGEAADSKESAGAPEPPIPSLLASDGIGAVFTYFGIGIPHEGISHATIIRASELIQEWEEEPGAPITPLIYRLFALFAGQAGP